MCDHTYRIPCHKFVGVDGVKFEKCGVCCDVVKILNGEIQNERDELISEISKYFEDFKEIIINTIDSRFQK